MSDKKIKITLPGFSVDIVKGRFYDAADERELDGGRVNSMLEKIAGMNPDETEVYINDNKPKLDLKRYKSIR